MIGGLGIVAHPVEQFRVALQLGAGRNLLAGDFLQRRRRHQFAALADHGEDAGAVVLGGQEIEPDRRRLGRIWMI